MSVAYIETMNADSAKNQSGLFGALAQIDMTVKPYGEVKKFLDERAKETMCTLKAVAVDVLSFESDKIER